jgi:tetratricopeptide (TPR) repeat protein
MKTMGHRQKCLAQLMSVGCSIAALSAPVSAEPVGRLLSLEGLIIVDPTNGRYLLLEGMPIVPVDKALPTSVTAIVDSGVAKDHPQFGGRVGEEVDFTGEGVNDAIGHGTVVALLAVSGFLAERNKLPKNDWVEQSITSLKVVDQNGTIRKEVLLAALAWIDGKKLAVVNLSLGFAGTYEEHSDLCVAIGRIKETYFFAAAGNSGPNVSSYPASCKLDNLISVGRLGPDGNPDPSSGKADIYVPSAAVLVPRAQQLLEEAKLLARQGKYAEALTRFDESIADHPLPEAHIQKGLIFLHQKKFSDSEAACRKAVELQRSIPEALHCVGLSRYLQGDLQSARQWIEEAQDLAPEDLRIHFNLALVLMDLKEYSNALAQLDVIQKKNPTYKNLLKTISEIKRREKLPKD